MVLVFMVLAIRYDEAGDDVLATYSSHIAAVNGATAAALSALKDAETGQDVIARFVMPHGKHHENQHHERAGEEECSCSICYCHFGPSLTQRIWTMPLKL
jgi:hypothetical protein